MPKQSSVRWTRKVRLDVRNGRFVKYTNNRINSAERYAWYLNSKHTALGKINSTRICAFPLKHTEHSISKNPPDNRQVAAPKGTTLVWLCGRWPRLVGGLWRGVNYTVNQLMHSECGRICRGAVGEGGLIRGGLLYSSIFFYSYGQNYRTYTVGPNQPGISIVVDWGTLLLHVQILHRAIHLNFKLG